MSRSSWVRIPAPYTGWTFFDGEVFADGEQLQEDVLECLVKICFNLNAFLKWANPGLFSSLFSFVSTTNFTEKIGGVSRIRTQTVGVEGKHADHLTKPRWV